MDWWKFESLLENQALYMARVDLLEDRFEGTYSSQQIADQDQWLRDKGYDDVAIAEWQERDRNRRRTYVSCWCVGATEFGLMWNSFVQEPPGVAIRTTVAKLKQACDDAPSEWRPLDISLVDYFDHAAGQFVNYPGMPGIFFHKDEYFRPESELRIAYWPNISGDIPEFVMLPVDVSKLVDCVVLSPTAPQKCLDDARGLLNRFGLSEIGVDLSRNDRVSEAR